AGDGGQREAERRNGRNNVRDRRERCAAPHAHQAQVEDDERSEERGNAEHVGEVDDGVRPGTGLAHEVAKRGRLHPRGEVVHAWPFHVRRVVLISYVFESRCRWPCTMTFSPAGIMPSLRPACAARGGGASTTFHSWPSAFTFSVACGPAMPTGVTIVPDKSDN